MNQPTNVSLLKEYIKTLVDIEVDFPGIQPRQWGKEFSRAELTAIHFTLKFVLKSAHPKTRTLLLKAFQQVNHPGMNMHWFLCDFWPEIVPLLTKHHVSAIEYPSMERPQTVQGLDLALLTIMAEPINPINETLPEVL